VGTAWGEVRYQSGATPTDKTYTGQRSYADDFGLMYYNARWYDSSLGRFAQADSIVPGGVQGYDRYAYVSNNPIMYTDPSGHTSCQDIPNEQARQYCLSQGGVPGFGKDSVPDVTLTTKGSGNCSGKCDGTRMYDLYLYLLQEKGDGFSAFDFLAWVLMLESGGNSDLLKLITDIAARRLWGTGLDATGNVAFSPYCSSSNCSNGIFNFIGDYSESAWARYSTYLAKDYSATKADPSGWGAGATRQDTVATLTNGTAWRGTFNNNTPIHWGTYKSNPKESDPALWWVPNMQAYFNNHDYDQIGNGAYQIVYMNGNMNNALTVVYTINQAATWGGLP
jgi:RHS repeat-associated protein